MQQSVEEGNTASEASSHAYVGGADEENLEALTLRVLEDMEDSSDFFASQKATSLPFFSPQGKYKEQFWCCISQMLTLLHLASNALYVKSWRPGRF
jgi:hypothetical protein